MSLILGLGVTQLLTGFIRAVRSRREVQVHWLPFAWGLSILAYHVGYFNVLYDLNESAQAWTWGVYGSVLFQAMLLFVGAGLLVPSDSGTAEDMLDDFCVDGRLALIPMGVLLATSPIMNRVQSGAPWFGLNNVFNVILTAVIVAALLSKSGRAQAAFGVAFASLTALGWAVAWAQPGAG